MVAMYTIAGKQVGSHVLAMITLGGVFAGSALSMRGGSKDGKQKNPPTNSSSKEEEAFIQEFLKNAETEDKKAKH